MRNQGEIVDLINIWKKWDLSVAELQELSELEADKERSFEHFYKDLSFGTAGIRGILGLGTNRLNRFNIRKATYALAKVALTQRLSLIHISEPTRPY